ncbi:MAG: trehalose-6-phosphate synthase [Gemmatimonadales bacterium]
MSLLSFLRRAPLDPLIVISNREPFVHERTLDGTMAVQAPGGGLIAALQPLMATQGGSWVAWGSGAADFEVPGEDDGLHVPPESSAYRLRRLAGTPATETIARELRQRHLPNGGQLLLGVDRADYTKGLPRRFRAFARMLEEHPELRGQVTLLQIAVPTRSDLPEYVALERGVLDLATEINTMLGQGDWQPIRLVQGSLDQATLAAHYRAADVCIVTPLLDGMNLVAKEYVACQQRPQGVLVLSRFAGAARELREALIVNPYDLGAVAATLHAALTLAPDERERRMRTLIRRLEGNTVQDWMDDSFAEVRRLSRDDE